MKGIQVIGKYLGDFPECYTIIGGTACEILFENAGLSFRATKAVDMILIAEANSPAFMGKLIELLQSAGYHRGWAKGDQALHFRFDQPTDLSFPHMLEIFCQGTSFTGLIQENKHLRLNYASDFSPISTFLTEGTYYQFVRNGMTESNGISILSEDYLIPLSIRAWIDLSAKKAGGEKVNPGEVLKHKKDVYRLCQLAIPNKIVPVSPTIHADIESFVKSLIVSDEVRRITEMKIQIGFKEIVDLLKGKYQIV